MRLLLAGDVAVLLAGAAIVFASAMVGWRGDRGETVVVRAGGQIVQTASLAQAQSLSVAGPLGTTRIEIEPGRARVAADPSPRQLCVKQGWLTLAGEAALCLPNQVSVEIRGAKLAYDTLGY